MKQIKVLSAVGGPFSENESMKVYRAIHRQDIEGARKAVSIDRGRDTERLDAAGIAKVAVETVAENAF